jgi:hypothetical protein
MFVQNAVPMTNGKLMSAGSSITYFVMSLVTLLFLYACHEIASYMILQYHFVITLLYSLVIIALGITCLIVDLISASDDVNTFWQLMS